MSQRQFWFLCRILLGILHVLAWKFPNGEGLQNHRELFHEGENIWGKQNV